MRTIIQRVSFAKVEVDGAVVGEINQGLLVLLGICSEDTTTDATWLIKKIIQLRIFKDGEDKMNLSVQDVGGQLLVVSQFTLYADCKKGNRPSFIRSAPPSFAIPMYEAFVEELKQLLPNKVATGVFGADMKISLLNDGPVTIFLDSKQPDF